METALVAEPALRLAGITKHYGSTVAVETRHGGANARPFAPYLYRQGAGVSYSDLARASYGYQDLPWYRRAADAGQPVWSLPYFDAGGGDTWMVTYSVPFFRAGTNGARQLAGVVTADLALDWVREAASTMRLEPFAAGWLASPPGVQEFVAPIGASDVRGAAAGCRLQ